MGEEGGRREKGGTKEGKEEKNEMSQRQASQLFWESKGYKCPASVLTMNHHSLFSHLTYNSFLR